MPNPRYGDGVQVGSLQQLTEGRGWNSALVRFLLPLATRNYLYQNYDFLNDTITADWSVDNSGGAGAANYAVTELEMGAIRNGTGTTDNGSTSFVFDRIIFDAARNPGMEVASKFDVVTGFAFEFGFSDAPTTAYTLNLSALTAAAVPTTNANGLTDYAIVTLNTDFTLATAALASLGTTDAVAGVAIATYTPTAAAYFVARLQVGNRNAYAIIDNNGAQAAALASGPDTAKLMRPHIISATKNTTAKVHDIDRITLWAERSY